ncbi:MAG: U32 family peptidase, partial [Erysipelotrichia bacterium]|nr:U32 family peptidase [Erysipelotrichia bacterium]
YLLSPKDLSTLDRISELLDTGISSLKIEGRMKRPEYVYLVTKTFREAVDAWQNNQEWHLSEERKQELLLMFNRGFTNGHLFHSSSKERMSHFRPNHQGVRIGTVIQYSHGRVLVKLQAPLYQHDGLRILNEPYDTGLTAVRIEKNGLLVNQAGAGDEVWLDCHSKPVPKPGQPLQKTSDAVLLKKIDDQIRDTVRRIPIEIQAYAHINSPLHLTATDPEGNTAEAYSTFIIEQAKSAPLTDEKMIQNLVKAKDQPYKITVTGIETDDVFLPVSAINDTRRTLLEKLSVIRSGGQSRNGKTVYQPSQITRTEISMPKLIAEINSDIQIRYPEQWNIQAQPADTDGQKLLAAVDEEDNDNALLQNSVISQIGSLNHPLDHVIAGMTFNCSNSYALAFLLKQKGIDGVILSSELSNYQISRMLDSFSEVYDFVPYTYRLVFGRRRLMYIKDGIGEEVIGNELRDLQQNVYPLKRAGRILEVLEQQPYQSENPYAYGSYIIFTDEQKQKACEIQEKAYEEVLR